MFSASLTDLLRHHRTVLTSMAMLSIGGFEMTDLANRFSDQGSPEHLPVLFLHAYPYQRAMWDSQARLLSGRARFLALDARGHTPGQGPVTAYLLEHLVDDVLALLDQRGIASCAVVGLSMGGYVALRLHQRAPERVRGLLLSNTQAAADSNEGKLGRAEGLRLLWNRGKEAFAEAQLKRQLSPQTLAEKPELVARLKRMVLELSPEALSASMVALATRPDLDAHLPSIRVPTSVVVGAHDVITPPPVAQTLASAIPNAALHVLEGAGHLSNVEAESRFNELMVDFVERVEGSAKAG
jgi:pimeloyl-ACP methyl ester carboxylesterase